MTERLDRSIHQGAAYLKAQQEECGSFWIWTSLQPEFPEGSLQERSVFATACILYCLEWLYTAAVEQIRSKALAFLRAEINERGLCCYLSSASRSQMLGGMPIAFTTLYDVDTTTCVSSLLRRHGTTLDNADTLLANQEESGLFRTWLMHEPMAEESAGFPFICLMPHQNRTCAGVNANALFYLGESGQTQATAERLADIFQQGSHCESSPYYPDEIVLFYLYSRAYFSGVRHLETAAPAILERLREHQRRDGSFGSPLQTAMALCTLLNFGCFGPDQAQSIRFLIETQAGDGSWARSCFYVGQDTDLTQEWRYGSLRRVYEHVPNLYFGSEEVTTAYCLEALSRYREAVL